jgi:hypothetical protein
MTSVLPALAEPVGTALVLAMDVSSSVDEGEYALQRDGLAQAFEDPAVHKAIWQQPFGRLAVAVVEWSTTPKTSIGWRVLETPAQAVAFAAEIRAMIRPTSIGPYTRVGNAIIHAVALLDACPCQPARRVIDVAGDGIDSPDRPSDTPPSVARDLADQQAVVINGLAIVEYDARFPAHHLATWYAENIQIGVGSFVMQAFGFADFPRVIRQKLVLEVAFNIEGWR